jgi:hypothetical protein
MRPQSKRLLLTVLRIAAVTELEWTNCLNSLQQLPSDSFVNYPKFIFTVDLKIKQHQYLRSTPKDHSEFRD